MSSAEAADQRGLPVDVGNRTYYLQAQPLGRIRRKITAIFALLEEGSSDLGVTDELYDALRVFVPDIAPKYELFGFVSQAAMEADEYDEATDHSPTAPQLADLVEQIYRVNGGERLQRLLGNLISPDLIRAWIRTEGLTMLTAKTAPAAEISPAS